MKDIKLAPGLAEILKATISENERQMLATSLGILGKRGRVRRPQVSYRAVDVFDFPCWEMHVSTGAPGAGIIALFVEENEDEIILLFFAKRGAPGNLSLAERNDAREFYRREMARREPRHE